MQALLINGSKVFNDSKAELSHTLQEVAKELLEQNGFTIIQTHINSGYIIQEELQKILDSHLIIYQLPAWWMGVPWIVKKYIGEVYTEGEGRLFQNDGRSSVDPSKNYGRGGLAKDKKVMFSVTWNAPLEAFTDKEEFFEGLGVEIVYLPLRKTHEFIGMNVLPTFMCNDVVKNPQIERYIADYKAHLQKYCIS